MVRHGEVINPVSFTLHICHDRFLHKVQRVMYHILMHLQGGDRPVYYGAMDVPLSPLGELEAIEAGAYLSNYKLQHVTSSPLSRAKFGARQIMTRQHKSAQNSDNSPEIIIFDGFRELDRGSWCGKTKNDIGEELMARFDACDESITPDGGESYPALKSRVLKARDQLLEITNVGRASAVVSHLQVTRAMLSEAMGMEVKEMAGLKIATASITCIDYCSTTGNEYVRFQSFKPECGLERSKDGAN